MAADRPFPPSSRRLGLARRSGLTAASPVVVAAIAAAAVVLAVSALGRAMAARLGAAIAAACTGPASGVATSNGTPAATGALGNGATVDATTGALATGNGATVDAATGALANSTGYLAPPDMVTAVLGLALPVIGAAAIAAVVAHVAQTRTIWLPRRRLEGAPALPPHRVRRAGVDLAAAAVIGAVAFGWLWLVAPRLAALPGVPLAGGAVIASAFAALVVAWVALGALDALVRHAELAAALQMTPREKREDERLAAADPRWRRLRAESARERRRGDRAVALRSDALAGATLLVLGDDAAVAIAWDAVHRPVPLRVASGRGPRATQLLGLARRDRVPVHRDAALAAALLGDGPVPEPHWPRLAEIVAAVRR